MTKENMGEKNDIRPYNEYFSEGTVSNTKHLVTSNLKPFDLEAAKAGKPVCTRDGRKVRIICFDSTLENYPLVVLVGDYPYSYTAEGKFNKDSESSSDLMMLPEKRSGWAVIRRSDIYETEEQAKEVLLNSRVGVMIRKIEWEE